MKKYGLCLCWLPFFVLLFIGSARGQVLHLKVINAPISKISTPDTLYYSPHRKLTWNDFKGPVRTGSDAAAITFTGFSYNEASRVTKDTAYVTIFIETYFDKRGSWVRPDSKTPYILSHEQLHFNIARLVTEQFRDTLLNGHFSYQNFESEIYALYLDYWRRLTSLQKEYDLATHHGLNHQQQEKWETEITAALDKLASIRE